MIGIPGGEFSMGSGELDKLAHTVEKPAHKVSVSDFWMDESELNTLFGPL